MDEISAANVRDRDLPRFLMQDEANDIVRRVIRSEVRYDANEIPTYLDRFPDFLKVQSGGGELNGEIEDSLHRSYAKLIHPHVNSLLLTQYEGFTLDSITQTLAEADDTIKVNTDATYGLTKAVRKLKDDPDHDVLADLIVRIHLANKDIKHNGNVHEVTTNRLNEVRDYLDLLLEGDGFDALLTPGNAPRP
jgi:hypothetical protein